MSSFTEDPNLLVEDEQLRRMLEQTLIPSPNVSILAPSPLLDFVNRMELNWIHPAESFHVNSKLTETDRDRLLDPNWSESVRKWFQENCGHVEPNDLTEESSEVALPHTRLPQRLGSTLSLFGANGPMKGLLYSADLMVVFDNAAYRQVGGADQLWKEHVIKDELMGDLTASPIGVDTDKFETAEAIVVLVGIPWRNMLFNGARGYRRMLLDTGMILSALGSACQQFGYEVTPCFDFVDRAVDKALANDGVERSALLLIALNDPSPLRVEQTEVE